ncbi:MAG: hypothetical protein D8H92_15430 [Campylobacter sp.]|nr:MAG: hypothetical protein D8H92_15430 [Campylobacter sp.]
MYKILKFSREILAPHRENRALDVITDRANVRAGCNLKAFQCGGFSPAYLAARVLKFCNLFAPKIANRSVNLNYKAAHVRHIFKI